MSNGLTWEALTKHHRSIETVQMRELFAQDPDRFQRMSREAAGVFVDYSKHRATDETLALLYQLARERDVEGWRDKMFAGEHINGTENRAVLHVALRDPKPRPEVAAVQWKMRDFTERLRSGAWLGTTGKPITDIVNIGIGGSDLGPVMVTEALRPYWKPGLNVHFVSNVDGTHVAETLKRVSWETTLFIIASKTFTTQETMTNARSAREWLVG
jgi:glucose-6-phosphate isomerase